MNSPFKPDFSQTLYKNQSGKVGYWRIDVTATGDKAEDTASLIISHSKTLGGKEVSSPTPVAGKNIGRANETTPLQQALAEAESRIKKQRDKGYVDTQEEATQPVTNRLGKKKPMLATPLEKVKPETVDWDNAWVQPKFDGHRCLNKEGIYSRGGEPLDVQHITDALILAGITDTPLDGELYAHGVHLNKIGSLVTKPQEESKQLSYYVYDLVEDLPFEDRLAILHGVFSMNDVPDCIRLAETIRVRSMEEALKHVDGWVAEGYEGGILRHGTEGYQDDKRSRGLLKLKKFSDMEVTVTGYRLGTPKVINGVTLQQPILQYITDDGKEAEVVVHGNAHEKHAEYERLSLMTHISERLTIKHFGFTSKGIPNIASAKCWYRPL